MSDKTRTTPPPFNPNDPKNNPTTYTPTLLPPDHPLYGVSPKPKRKRISGITTERIKRGQWYRVERQKAMEQLRDHLLPLRTTFDPETGTTTYTRPADRTQQLNANLVFATLKIYYALCLRLPDIREYTPKLTKPCETIIQWAEHEIRRAMPSLVLRRWER